METKKINPQHSCGASKAAIKKAEAVKAPRHSYNPMSETNLHSHFEVAVHQAFFRIFSI